MGVQAEVHDTGKGKRGNRESRVAGRAEQSNALKIARPFATLTEWVCYDDREGRAGRRRESQKLEQQRRLDGVRDGRLVLAESLSAGLELGNALLAAHSAAPV